MIKHNERHFNMKKALITSIITISLCLAALAGFADAREREISVRINGTALEFSAQGAVSVDGRVLVPVRNVFETLGFRVLWNQDTQQVHIENENFTIRLTIGSREVIINGDVLMLDAPIQIIGGSTMAQIRPLMEAVGLYVSWSGIRQIVSISETPAVDICNTRWFEHGHLVAHSMGAIDGRHFGSNSLEAFRQNYALGHRIFEVDLQLSTDGKLITIHPSLMPVPQTFAEANAAARWHTVMTFDQLLLLMLEYEDVFIVTDTKYYDDFDLIRETFDIMWQAIHEIDPALKYRLIIQFYNQEMFHFMKEYWDFPNYAYTLYMSRDTNAQVLEFVRQEGINAVVMWYHRAMRYPEFVAQLGEAGAVVFAHTINDLPLAQRLLDIGVYGIYTNVLTYEQLPFTPPQAPPPQSDALFFYRQNGQFRIPVLAYHSIMPQQYYYPINYNNQWILHLDTFYAQMRYLYENNFNTITTAQLVDFLFYEGQLPKNPVMLTFDDGYLDNALFAAEILRQFGFTGAVFLITNTIQETSPRMRASPIQFMSETEILAAMDVFEFGSHSHYMHRRVDGQPAFKHESVYTIRDDLLRSFDFPLTFRNGFAFPHGFYCENSLAALREVGVRFAFTTQTGYLTQNVDPLRIPRFSIIGGPDGHTMQDFSDIMQGRHGKP